MEAQGCQGMVLTVYRLVLFIPQSRNTPAAASAVWPQRGSRAAAAQLRSLFSSSCRAAARNSPSNHSLALSLQLPRFPGSSEIAHRNVTLITCTARTISELPHGTRVPPLHQRGFLVGLHRCGAGAPLLEDSESPGKGRAGARGPFPQTEPLLQRQVGELNLSRGCQGSLVRSCRARWITVWGRLVPHAQNEIQGGFTRGKRTEETCLWVAGHVLSHWI